MQKSVDTNESSAYTYLVSGKQPNDSPQRNWESPKKKDRKMKTMTNPKEWLKIQMTYRPEQIMKHTGSNLEMRSYISSYGFRAPRELAQQILEMLEV